MSIRFENVHKILRQKERRTSVLEGAVANFRVEAKTAVIGAPSSGKTTTMNLATGRLRPDRGVIRRTSLVSFPVANGSVFNGMLSGRENLAFLCRVFGFDPKPIGRFILEYADLGDDYDKPVKLLDRDQKVRLVFTASYAIPFDLYVVDETMVGGRGGFREDCEQLVTMRMKTAGFLLFTSSPLLAKKYCTEFYALKDRALTRVKTPEEAEQLIGSDLLRPARAAKAATEGDASPKVEDEPSSDLLL